jgi:hypothetical protein
LFLTQKIVFSRNVLKDTFPNPESNSIIRDAVYFCCLPDFSAGCIYAVLVRLRQVRQLAEQVATTEQLYILWLVELEIYRVAAVVHAHRLFLWLPGRKRPCFEAKAIPHP